MDFYRKKEAHGKTSPVFVVTETTFDADTLTVLGIVGGQNFAVLTSEFSELYTKSGEEDIKPVKIAELSKQGLFPEGEDLYTALRKALLEGKTMTYIGVSTHLSALFIRKFISAYNLEEERKVNADLVLDRTSRVSRYKGKD